MSGDACWFHEPVLTSAFTPPWFREEMEKAKTPPHLAGNSAAAFDRLLLSSPACRPFPSSQRFAEHNGPNLRFDAVDKCRQHAKLTRLDSAIVLFTP